MKDDKSGVMTLAMMVRHANVTGDAALLCDFDEARFPTRLLVSGTSALGMQKLAAAATILSMQLGPVALPARNVDSIS